MHSKFLLFGAALAASASLAMATFVVDGLALQLPLLSATAGTLSLPLAVLGVLKLGAAASLLGLGVGSILGGGLAPAAPAAGYTYRSKRAAETTVSSQEAIFGLVSSMDLYSCGKALVCGLQAKDPATLSQDESLILTLFADRKSKHTVNSASPKAEYDLAAQLGLAARDEVVCRKRYSTCPYTADEMMMALRQANL